MTYLGLKRHICCRLNPFLLLSPILSLPAVLTNQQNLYKVKKTSVSI